MEQQLYIVAIQPENKQPSYLRLESLQEKP